MATGRSDIKYAWYRRKYKYKVDDLTRTDNTSQMVANEKQSFITYHVHYSDVVEGHWKTYQCSARSGSDVIFSNLAKIKREIVKGWQILII